MSGESNVQRQNIKFPDPKVRTPTILVVDDDLHTRLAISIWLKQCGFRVALSLGATRCLRKPFHPEALHAMVEEIRARLG